MGLSIIMPVLNDQNEANATIRSIRSTSPAEVEIVVVDDGSEIPLSLEDKSVVLIRLEKRIGAGAARHAGVMASSGPYIFLTDSHMRFESGWYQNSIDRMDSTPASTVWCGSCLGLSPSCMDLSAHPPPYFGASLCFYDPVNGDVFEGKWRAVEECDDYPIPCLMGACYFMHKEWFERTGGLYGNRHWGGEEPFLSLKTWLAGGEIRLAKTVRVGHQFREKASYETDPRYPDYNKIRSIMVTLPVRHRNFLVSKMPGAMAAMPLVADDMKEIMAERSRFQSVAVRDIKWFCDRFNINTFN